MTRTLLCPARLGALVIGLALAAVYAVGGLAEVVGVVIAGVVLLAAWAWCAIGGEADAVADQAVRTRGVWS
jgi:hypothetical protein